MIFQPSKRLSVSFARLSPSTPTASEACDLSERGFGPVLPHMSCVTGCNSIHLRSRCPDYGGPLLPTMRRTSVRVFPWKEPLSAKNLERCRISRATTTVASRQRTWAKLSCFLAPGEALRRVAHRRSDQDSGIRRSRGRVSPSWKMSVKKAPFRLSSR